MQTKKTVGLKKLTRDEMKNILRGKRDASDCPSGTAPCTCNGTAFGCQTVSGCWDKC